MAIERNVRFENRRKVNKKRANTQIGELIKFKASQTEQMLKFEERKKQCRCVFQSIILKTHNRLHLRVSIECKTVGNAVARSSICMCTYYAVVCVFHALDFGCEMRSLIIFLHYQTDFLSRTNSLHFKHAKCLLLASNKSSIFFPNIRNCWICTDGYLFCQFLMYAFTDVKLIAIETYIVIVVVSKLEGAQLNCALR